MSIEHTYKICDEEFTEVLTKAKAIRKHCLDCCSGFQSEVAKCMVKHCPLFPFRFGNEKGLERVEHLKAGYVDPEKEKEFDEVDEVEEIEEDSDDELEIEPETKPEPVKRKKIRRIIRKKGA